MIRATFFLSLCLLTSAKLLNDPKLFRTTYVHGHEVGISSTGMSDMKWMYFPRQHDIQIGAVVNEDTLLFTDDFWLRFGSEFGLSAATNMVLAKEWSSPDNKLHYKRFHQMIFGVRVFGGDIHVTIGEHGGVLEIHGLPVSSEPHKPETVTSTSATVQSLHPVISKHLETLNFGANRVVRSTNELELVWYMPQVSHAKTGNLQLAHYITGYSTDGEFLAFDAFVSVDTAEVLSLIIKQNQASPFSDPLDAMVIVYDQYLKDFNDDQDDTYYYQDPDRYSSTSVVFNSSNDDYVYPTSDEEMNLLVDNTLYIKYLMYSLSNGEYVTWNKDDFPLNIEYNLSIANAYFDTHWGIHFGSGYITDDVVVHEWAHGYTQTVSDLIYQYQSGAMNEALSDIFGEAVDILNKDTSDTEILRTEWPTQCSATLNSRYFPPGTDTGHRWSLGEEIATSYANGDGSIRDMYTPECYIYPPTTYSELYICSNIYGDNGGVHMNSGVLNRLFAVLVDGGQYENPSNPSSLLTVDAIGMNKALNLFWRAHQQLTSTSQYLDMALALSSQCDYMVSSNAAIYYPNILNATIIELDEKMSVTDCANVETAITGSGMDTTDDICPTVDCNEDGYDCGFVQCDAGNITLAFEEYTESMNSLVFPGCFRQNTSVYLRVFTQEEFDMENLEIGCVEFGINLRGAADVKIELYIDTTGGEPDYESLVLLSSATLSATNSGGYLQLLTASMTDKKPLKLKFGSEVETLVVMLTVPLLLDGYVYAGGKPNTEVTGTGLTYTGGWCRSDIVTSYDAAVARGLGSFKNNQWYVQVHGQHAKKKSNNDEAMLSSDGIIGVSVAAGVVALALIVGVGYMIYIKVTAKPLLDAKGSPHDNL